MTKLRQLSIAGLLSLALAASAHAGDIAVSPKVFKGLHQIPHHRVGMERRGREPQAFRATRHGWVIDRLHIDAMNLEQSVRDLLAQSCITDHDWNDVARAERFWFNDRQARLEQCVFQISHRVFLQITLEVGSHQMRDAGANAPMFGAVMG